ncbi:hypothetical protein DBR42_26485 [Pelomonas sp. HMWF004]|nr:hypothetical protein DBR42_26485 [Pelomonas sp. HMWF004]
MLTACASGSHESAALPSAPPGSGTADIAPVAHKTTTPRSVDKVVAHQGGGARDTDRYTLAARSGLTPRWPARWIAARRTDCAQGLQPHIDT